VHDSDGGRGRGSRALARVGGELRLLLWAVWNPIGYVPIDEYESYAPAVWRLLAEGADEASIASHLTAVREEAIGTGTKEQDERAASVLDEWWHWRFQAEDS
jgi:hypothetical protein